MDLTKRKEQLQNELNVFSGENAFVAAPCTKEEIKQMKKNNQQASFLKSCILICDQMNGKIHLLERMAEEKEELLANYRKCIEGIKKAFIGNEDVQKQMLSEAKKRYNPTLCQKQIKTINYILNP